MLQRSVKPVSELVKRVYKNDLATVPSANWSGMFRSMATEFADDVKGNKNKNKCLLLCSVLIVRLHYVIGPTYDFRVTKSKRLSTPPQFKALESYCHYPILIVATPTITNTTGYKKVRIEPKSNASTFTEEHFVDVPFEVSPGELFRVLIAGEEYLVTCPDITRPGERVVVVTARTE